MRQRRSGSAGILVVALVLAASPASPANDDALTAFATGDERTRIRTVLALRKADASALPILLQGLADPSTQVRVFAAGLLAERRREELDPSMLPALTTALADSNPQVRAEVTRVVGRMGPRALPILPVLRRQLAERAAGLTGPTARAIVEIGAPAGDLRAAVAPLGDADEFIRETTAFWLSKVAGEDSQVAIPLLAGALADSDPKVRDLAAYGLAMLGRQAEPGPAATGVTALAAALADESWKVRSRAAYALASFGPAAEPATAALEKAARDRDWRVTFEAATTLAILHGGRP